MKKRYLLSILIIFLIFIFPVSVFAQLPDSLKGSSIEKDYFPSKYKKVGKIGRLTGKGKVIISRKEIKRGFYADEGDPVHEMDSVYTVGDCRARLEFRDGNIVIMSSDSHLELNRVFFDAKEGKKSSLFYLWAGKVICYAVKLFRYPQVEFKLKTKTAIVGVRGTKFGVEIISDKMEQSFEIDNLVAGLRPYIAQASSPSIITKVYGIEGRVSVTSLVDGRSYMLKENEIIDAGPVGLGTPVFNPEGVKKFIEEIMESMTPVSEEPENVIRDRDIMKEEMERREEIEQIKQMEIREPKIHHEEPPTPPPSHGLERPNY